MVDRIEVSEIGNVDFTVEIHHRHPKELEGNREELKAFEGVCEIKQFYYLREDEEKGTYYVDYTTTRLLYKGVLLYPIKKHYNSNSYRFSLDRRINGNYQYYCDFAEKNKMPNYVGKPTAAKMDEWLDFLLREEAYMINRLEEKNNFKAKFKKSLEGRDVKWNSDTKGYIRGNRVEYEFEIGEKSVYSKIILECESTLENFDRISETLKK